MMRCALTIAGSDPSSGAGIQVDLAVFREIGIYGLSVVTNVTAQNSLGVHKVCKVPPRVIAAQIDAVARDFEIGACKVGMLYSPQAVDAVAERIRRRELPKIVVDPVMAAKRGETLLTPPALKRLKRALLPLAALVTPNAAEAEALTGIVVTDRESAAEAARALVGMGARAALVKGGHVEGEPVDVLFDGTDLCEFGGKRLEKTMHGAGCVLSAAIAARLALGDGLADAVAFAKDYVTSAIERSVRMGKGKLDYFLPNYEL